MTTRTYHLVVNGLTGLVYSRHNTLKAARAACTEKCNRGWDCVLGEGSQAVGEKVPVRD